MNIDVKGWLIKALQGIIEYLEGLEITEAKPIWPDKPKKGYLTPNFHRSEFICKCGCGRIGAWPVSLMKLTNKLEELRDLVGKPIKVSSGYRCPKHNYNVGGATNSLHMLDQAADVYVEGMTEIALADAADLVGFGGIGVYTRTGNLGWVHLDVGQRARWNG